MIEQDEKKEDKRAELNKTILDLADGAIHKYMVKQASLPADSDALDMDRIIKISKNFAGRVLLDEGKNTANIGLNSGAGGFNVTFIETVAGQSSDDNTDVRDNP